MFNCDTFYTNTVQYKILLCQPKLHFLDEQKKKHNVVKSVLENKNKKKDCCQFNIHVFMVRMILFPCNIKDSPIYIRPR